jgi:hypothetical protein
MYRRDEFIKKLSSLNSGDSLREQVKKLEVHVDAELKKADTVLSLINSNPQGTVVGNTETINDITETYAVHTESNISGNTEIVDGKVVWNDGLTFNNGKGSASASPWTHINISANSFDGNIKILLPEDTNKNAAKMLADRYMDTTVQADYPVGGHWGEGNVLVTHDLVSNKLYMIFKLTHVPVESTTPKFFSAVGKATATCSDAETGEEVTVELIRWSNKTPEDAQQKADKAALAEAYSKLVCVPKEVHYATIKVEDGWYSTCEGLLGFGYRSSTSSDIIKMSDFTNSDVVGTGSTPIDARNDAEKKVRDLALAYINIGSSEAVCKPLDHKWEPVRDANGCFDTKNANGESAYGQLECKQHQQHHRRNATKEEWDMYYKETSNGVYCPVPPSAETLPVVTMATPTQTQTQLNDGSQATIVYWQFDFDKAFKTDTLITASYNDGSSTISVSFYSGTGVLRKTHSTTHVRSEIESYDVTLTLNSDSGYSLGAVDTRSKTTTIPVYINRSPDPNCLKEGTMITMLDGSLRPIETLSVGDKLKSFNIHQLDVNNESVEYLSNWKTPTITYDDAETTIVSIRKASVNVIYSFNDVLYSTASHDHMIYDGENYRVMYTRDVKEGYYLINKTGELEEITSIKILEDNVNVYYLNAEDYDIYIANDYITHNNAKLKEDFATGY